MGAVSQPNETNLLGAHTYTHRAPSGQWKCHIIGFPFQDNRHAHWIRSDHRRQFSPCLPLSAFPSLFFAFSDCLLFASLCFSLSFLHFPPFSCLSVYSLSLYIFFLFSSFCSAYLIVRTISDLPYGALFHSMCL